ncbi:glutamine-dependent NAD(+) synthetase [Phenylobacterium zucineum HLK1]|uniref:Glutamine-dependent NAD(+) synthetase n=1 Tax=Phenylobacterium zucineum (strain HLK1) TaxID=450851 RepID=B4RDF2_PHEZH|nr:NAD(+) synthase [Phenylobacterium zucineum]ACG78342.1 glutamine-dependent NAD(+) synthetase [Phenylobacterium zucineum HLK1]
MTKSFYAIHSHGFVRVAACTPRVAVGDPGFNAAETLRMAHEGDARGCDLMLFPELGISAYAIDDLLLQDALLKRVEDEIAALAAASAKLSPVLVVGAPVARNGRLYNCAVAIARGRILGVVPKSYLPNYREYYEKRWFAPGHGVEGLEVELAGQAAPFGTDLLFEASDLKDFVFHAEICEDFWAPAPPSTEGALAGALILCNLSASNIVVGKADERALLCASQSARCSAAYLYSAAGPGESTTDLAWDGQASIHELGRELACTDRFPTEAQMAVADIDVEKLRLERMRSPTFNDAAIARGHPERRFRRVRFEHRPHGKDVGLLRPVDRFPFVPDDPARLDKDCYEAFNIQVQGLVKRLESTKSQHIVIGVSGGLDSTHALIVAAKAFDRLGKPRSDILGFTMPGFATSEGTKSNAWKLMRALGVTAEEIDIRPAATQLLKDMGHPFAAGEPVYDVTFENVQAGLRTDYLFRLANQRHGFVLGTGDLSELALGWCTYGVGDQMSHYNVNGSVAKTLIQHLIRWVAKTGQFDTAASETLLSVLDTEISPELVPADASGAIQSTQAKIGPYELQDFNVYWITRYGLRPSKVAFLAWHAWRDVAEGSWPPHFPAEARNAYDLATIKKWLSLFLFRFFEISQFKRSAMPNGPKVISGGNLSPRGDWRAPSDGVARVWLEELEANVP